jgi:hypothetical protein
MVPNIDIDTVDIIGAIPVLSRFQFHCQTSPSFLLP